MTISGHCITNYISIFHKSEVPAKNLIIFVSFLTEQSLHAKVQTCTTKVWTLFCSWLLQKAQVRRAGGRTSLMIMPRLLSGCQIKAKIQDFLLMYRLFQYQQRFCQNLDLKVCMVSAFTLCIRDVRTKLLLLPVTAQYYVLIIS